MEKEDNKKLTAKIPETRITRELRIKIDEVLQLCEEAGYPTKLSDYVNRALKEYTEDIIVHGLDIHINPKIK